MVGNVIRDLDLGADREPARDGRVARVERRTVNALAPPSLKLLAREPVVPPARLARAAVLAVRTRLALDVCAWQHALLEAVLRGLLLLEGGQVVGVEKLVDDGLVLADAVGEHASVVAVVVDAPLDVNDIAGFVCRDRGLAPVGAGLVVVDTYTGVVAAGAGAGYLGGI